MIKKEKVTLKSQSDDLMLSANVYICENPKAIVQIIHGMAEHKERYEQLANVLATFGCITVVVDNRGHGESVSESVPLGYFADKNGWLINLQDIHMFSLDIREKYRHLPFFILGHSMGALIGHSYLKRYEDIIDGAIFSGMPAYNNKAALAKMLANMMKPKSVSKLLTDASDYNKFIAKPNTRYDWLSYNTDNVDAYISDPLCGFPFTNRGFYDLLDGMQDVYTRSDWRVLKKQMPILFVVGEDDVCADVGTGFKNALNHLSKVGYSKIEANIYQNMRHEIFNEKEKKIVYKDILTWLSQQLTAMKEKNQLIVD